MDNRRKFSNSPFGEEFFSWPAFLKQRQELIFEETEYCASCERVNADGFWEESCQWSMCRSAQIICPGPNYPLRGQKYFSIEGINFLLRSRSGGVGMQIKQKKMLVGLFLLFAATICS